MRILLLATLATMTVGLSGCFGFDAAGGAIDFRPGEDFEVTGNTVHLRAKVADLVNHEVFPGFKANLWAFCMIPADPADQYSADAVEYFNTIESDGELVGAGGPFADSCSVPAPTLRVKQGDNVIVDFENDHFHCHTIHWHGQYVPWLHDGVPGVTQHSVCPASLDGSEQPIGDNPFRYEFIASRAGTLWYHCHVDTQFHVMQGLFGMFIVEPQNQEYEPEDVDAEYEFVYSTLNRELVEVTPVTLADPHAQHRHGGCGMSGRQGCQNPAVDTTPDVWMLNGRGLPYTTMDDVDTLITVEEGDRVRVRILNAGETVETIHTHGHDMYVTHIDGNPIPPAARYYVDTLMIGPASRYDVTIDMDNPGIWVMHTHVDHHVTNSHQAPGGGFTMIAYQSALDQNGGKLKAFEGAELTGGTGLILPLDIPMDAKFGTDRNVGAGIPDVAAGINVDESWSFDWELPCATRYGRITVEYDAGVPDQLAAALLDLDITITDRNGDPVSDEATATLSGDGTQFTWVRDGRYDVLAEQTARDAQAAERQNMISNYLAGPYTVSVSGTAAPGDLRFVAELDYHADEAALNAEKTLAAYDVSKGAGDCDPAKRVFTY